MTVKELIAELQKQPQDLDVVYVWDGEARGQADHVWLARGGFVVICSDGEAVYSTGTRPKAAPTASKNPYWSMRNPN